MTPTENFRVRYFQDYFRWTSDLRLGWDEFDFRDPSPEDLTSLSLNSAASLIQAWLFFGLLDVVARSEASAYLERRGPGPLQDGLEAVGGQQPINSSEEYVVVNEEQIVIDIERHLSGPQRKEKVASALTYLELARRKCEQLDEASYWTHTKWSSVDMECSLASVFLSIRLLLSHLRVQVHRYERIPTYYEMIANRVTSAFRGQTPKEGRQTYSQYNKILKSALPPGATHQSILSDRELAREFASSNWCPARAWQMRCFFNIFSVYSLARVRRNQETGINHALCDTVCTAYNMSEEELRNYRQLHVEGCDCNLAEPQHPDRAREIATTISNIINADAIPLISLKVRMGKPQIKVLQYDGSVIFTAISHVWRDGLGNTTNNVHDCQLKRLAKILDKVAQQNHKMLPPLERLLQGKKLGRFFYPLMFRLYFRLRYRKSFTKEIPEREGRLFWLDTLCIPHERQSTNAKEYQADKDRAIRLITPTFQAASHVLVLDSDLDTVQSSATDYDTDTDIQACLLGCKWMQRVWTLEEGGQARQCWVRIANDTVHKLRSQSDSLLSGPLNEARKMAINMRSGRKASYWLERIRATQFKDAWNNIQYRSISKQSDLLKTFASILDLDPMDLPRDGNDSSKLALIVKSCRSVPLALLFARASSSPTATNYEDRGLDTWIPPSLEKNPITNGISMRSYCYKEEHRGFEVRVKDVYGSESLEIMTVPTTELFASGVVQLEPAAFSDCHLVLESQCGHIHHPYTEALLMFDKAAGSRSRNAHFALGALLVPIEDDVAVGSRSSRWNGLPGSQQPIVYKHIMHLTVYLPDQWEVRCDGATSDLSRIPKVHGCSPPETLSRFVIRTEPTPKHKLMGQRPPRDYPSTTPQTLLAYVRAVGAMVLLGIIMQCFNCWKGEKPCWAERCPGQSRDCDPFRNCPDPYWNGRRSPGCMRVYFSLIISMVVLFSFGYVILNRVYARRHKTWLQTMVVGNRVHNGRISGSWWNRAPWRGRHGSGRDVEEAIGLDENYARSHGG